MFTKNDVALVLAYNVKAKMFYVSSAKRVQWSMLNKDKTYLQSVLSKELVYAEDFALLKKQVRAELVAQGQL